MIYSVEDNSSIRELIIYALSSQGYLAKGVGSSSELFEEMEKTPPTLILLDIMLPTESGIEILEKLKRSGKSCDVPVIMVSAKDSEYDKVNCLDKGADDYISKPFGMMELVSRVKALLRRSGKTSEGIFAFGKITVDKGGRKVFVDEEEILLTMKEYDLLTFLLDNKKLAVSRAQLLEGVWGFETELLTRTLDVHINTLRSKLRGAGSQIETIRGVGYMLVEE